MSRMVIASPAATETAGRWCRECGYSLRGLPPGKLCPECGHPDVDEAQLNPHTAWSRAVAAGLALLLIVTLHAVSSVLIQPFTEQVGGTAPALNLPGPKLWAMPLLQRPIGNSPETPGVVGTRTAMLSLLAVWLITTPCAAWRQQRDQTLRLITRWTSVTLFGLAFGALLNSQGLWPSELPPFRLMLVALVELPATTLLYLYLRSLAMQLPGRERRALFDRLAWCAPIVIAGGAMILWAQWWLGSGWAAGVSKTTTLAWSAGYGAAAMLCGVACTAAVGGLALAHVRLASPSTSRALRWVHGGTRRMRSAAMRMVRRDGRRFAIATGLVLLLIVMIAGNDCVMWISTRQGLGGNLPFVNFPGPKVWASAAITQSGAMWTGYWWSPLTSRMTLIALNVAALWLIATPLPDNCGGKRVRAMARWLPAALIGAAMCCINAARVGYSQDVNVGAWHSEFFAAATVLCELPATIVLYVLLARLAEQCAKPRLARQFRAIGLVIVALVATSLATFALSRYFLHERSKLIFTIMAAAYGAAALLSAAWATASVVRLIGVVAWRGREKKPPASRRLNRESTIALL